MRLSIIVPTVDRPSLTRTLQSIADQPLQTGDEVLVVGGTGEAVLPFADLGFKHLACQPGRNWGCDERTLGIAAASGSHLAFLDDDDWWTEGARQTIAAAVSDETDRPFLFRMQYAASGSTLWFTPEVKVGNVSTQMIVVPNRPERLGRWTTRREGDHDFIASWTWQKDQIVWREEVIAMIGRHR